MGLPEDMIIDVDGATVELIYSGSDWRLKWVIFQVSKPNLRIKVLFRI